MSLIRFLWLDLVGYFGGLETGICWDARLKLNR